MTDDREYALRQANGESLDSILNEVRRDAWEEGWRGGAEWPQADKNPYDG